MKRGDHFHLNSASGLYKCHVLAVVSGIDEQQIITYCWWRSAKQRWEYEAEERASLEYKLKLIDQFKLID